MIPKKRSEAIVNRVVEFCYQEREHKKQIHHCQGSTNLRDSTLGDNTRYYSSSLRRERPKILDFGTGCGNLLVSILHQLRPLNARGLGIDASLEALGIANYNIVALGLHDSTKTVHGKLQFAREFSTQFNVVVCNPPYHCYDNKNNEIGAIHDLNSGTCSGTMTLNVMSLPITPWQYQQQKTHPILDTISLAYKPHRAFFVNFYNRQKVNNLHDNKNESFAVIVVSWYSYYVFFLSFSLFCNIFERLICAIPSTFF